MAPGSSRPSHLRPGQVRAQQWHQRQNRYHAAAAPNWQYSADEIGADAVVLLRLLDEMEENPRRQEKAHERLSAPDAMLKASPLLPASESTEIFARLRRLLPSVAQHLDLLPPLVGQLCAAILLVRPSETDRLWNSIAERRLREWAQINLEPWSCSAAHVVYEYMAAYCASQGRFPLLKAILVEMTSNRINLQPTYRMFIIVLTACRLFRDHVALLPAVQEAFSQIWRSRIEHCIRDCAKQEQRATLLSFAAIVCGEINQLSDVEHLMRLVSGFEVQLSPEALRSLTASFGRVGDVSRFRRYIVKLAKEYGVNGLTEEVCLQFVRDALKVSMEAVTTFIEVLLEAKYPHVPTQDILDASLFVASEKADLDAAEYVFKVVKAGAFSEDGAVRRWRLTSHNWGALFRTALRHNLPDAIEVLIRMKEHNFIPSKGVYIAVIEYLARIGDSRALVRTIAEISKAMLTSSMLHRIIRTMAAWNWEDDALAAFTTSLESSASVDVKASEILMQMFLRLGKQSTALKVFQDMRKRGHQPSVGMYIKVFQIIGIRGGPRAIRHVLEMFKEDELAPTTEVYNVLIELAAIRQQPQEAMAYYRRMLRHGLEPDATTFTRLLRALTNANEGAIAYELYISQIMPRNSLKWSAALYHAILHVFMKRSAIQSALEVTESFRQQGGIPSELAYATLLKAFARKGDVPKTLQLLQHFLEQGITMTTSHIHTVLLDAILLAPEFEAMTAELREGMNRQMFSSLGENYYAAMIPAERTAVGWQIWTAMRSMNIVPRSKTYMSMVQLCTSLADMRRLLDDLIEVLPEQIVSPKRELYITRRLIHYFAAWFVQKGGTPDNYSAFQRVALEAERWTLADDAQASRTIVSDDDVKAFIAVMHNWLNDLM